MRRYWIFCTFFLCATFLMLPWVSANSTLRVNQAKTKASLFTDKIQIALAIGNVSSKSLNANIKLELLDTRNVVQADTESEENFSTGLHIVPFNLPLETEDEKDAENLALVSTALS